ncbi:hypothetical protein BGZ65_011725, partial [Modicella reniformis]
MEKNYGANECKDVNQYIQSTIRDLVQINTDLIRYGSIAVLNHINTVMAEHPSVESGSQDIEIRRNKLQYIADEKHVDKALYYGEDQIN